MAFTGITATEAEIDQQSGANVDTNFTDTMKTQSLLQAENTLNIRTRFNWSDWYATSPNVDLKYMITATTSKLVAIDAINYNMDAIGRSTAESRVNVLRDAVLRNFQILAQIEAQTFIIKNQ